MGGASPYGVEFRKSNCRKPWGHLASAKGIPDLASPFGGSASEPSRSAHFKMHPSTPNHHGRDFWRVRTIRPISERLVLRQAAGGLRVNTEGAAWGRITGDPGAGVAHMAIISLMMEQLVTRYSRVVRTRKTAVLRMFSVYGGNVCARQPFGYLRWKAWMAEVE